MAVIKKYYHILKIGIAEASEYRFNILVQVLFWWLPLFMQLLIWKTVYSENVDSHIMDYSLNGMVTYYYIAFIIYDIVKTENIEWAVIRDIRDGELQRFLVQPINYILFRFTYLLSKKVIVIFCVCFNIISAKLLLNDYIDLEFQLLSLLLFCFSIFMSLIIIYCIHICIAFFSFWFTEFTAIFHFLPFVFSVLYGTAFPLDILPERIQQIFIFSPFYYVVFFPTKILVAPIDGNLIACFGGQITWTLIGCLACKLLWKNGISKFSATGG